MSAWWHWWPIWFQGTVVILCHALHGMLRAMYHGVPVRVSALLENWASSTVINILCCMLCATGLCHTILFNRALGQVRPKDVSSELFDITYVRLQLPCVGGCPKPFNALHAPFPMHRYSAETRRLRRVLRLLFLTSAQQWRGGQPILFRSADAAAMHGVGSPVSLSL